MNANGGSAREQEGEYMKARRIGGEYMKGRLDFVSSCEQSRIHERHKKHFSQTHAHTHTYTRTCAHTRIP